MKNNLACETSAKGERKGGNEKMREKRKKWIARERRAWKNERAGLGRKQGRNLLCIFTHLIVPAFKESFFHRSCFLRFLFLSPPVIRDSSFFSS